MNVAHRLHYVYQTIHVTGIVSQKRINWLIFVMENQCVCCEAGTELLHAPYTDFMLERVVITLSN